MNLPLLLQTLDALTGKSKGKNAIVSNVTLDPGTYCGGLQITKNAVVTLRPGIDVMKDGPLIVDKKEAKSALPEIARDAIRSNGNDLQTFTVCVRDEANASIYTATLTFSGIRTSNPAAL